MPPVTSEARLVANTTRIGECLIWTGKRNNKGYGLMFHAGKNRYAHRAAYMMVYGEIPAGMQVRHKCDVPACVRADHLELGTQADNMQDMASRGRASRAPKNWGTNHGMSKLTDDDVLAIRSRAERGESYASIARDVGISGVEVGLVARGERWAHLPGAVPRRAGAWRASALTPDQVADAVARVAAGESRGSVARSLGVSKTAIRRWLRLHRAAPTGS